MNEITEVTITPDVPFDLDMVEILDEQGNPTGQYRPRDVTSTATTIYTTAEDGEHEVTIH
jgi:hypothetical protein